MLHFQMVADPMIATHKHRKSRRARVLTSASMRTALSSGKAQKARRPPVAKWINAYEAFAD